MAADMNAELSLDAWLNKTRESVLHSLAGSEPVLRLVTGNEASDADSIVSALTCAYLSDKGKGITIPLVMCDRDDVALRRETVLLLEKCGVDVSKLFFGNDPAVKELIEKGLVREVILVDHNKATGPIAQLDKQIVTILDHHKDFGAHSQVVGDARNIAFEGESALAGCCGTLIAEKFLSDSKDWFLRANGAVARALIGIILIDTVNCDPEVNKATARDIAVIEALTPLLFGSPDERTALFNDLSNAKNDSSFWQSLSVAQCLRYDYKCFEFSGKPVGISSVLCSLEDLAGKDGWSDSLTKWASEVELFAIQTVAVLADGSIKRQLLLAARDSELSDKAAIFLMAYKTPVLQLNGIELSGPLGLKAFDQGNTAASRKQVAPGVAAFFASL